MTYRKNAAEIKELDRKQLIENHANILKEQNNNLQRKGIRFNDWPNHRAIYFSQNKK